ncbi:MAG TPA: lysophospholipid acyltransferase family protein [Blastocatellia bacterium]|nr:lysophospholipid acyltransferase family protein [Blastocatellia bacterium]
MNHFSGESDTPRMHKERFLSTDEHRSPASDLSLADVRTLRFSEMIRQQKGSVLRRLVHFVISSALRLFFHRIQISNVAAVPLQGPLIFVLNHPNGLLDPALVFCALPRRVSFLAKSTLFHLPVLGWLLRTVEALPLYRRIDEGASVDNNQLTFAACHALLQAGRCIALFPEGISHRAPALQPIKTGAARIALGALSVTTPNQPPLTRLLIMPIGLYYSSRTPFRGEALLQCGVPLEITAPHSTTNGEPEREQVRELTERIAAALQSVTLNFTDVEEQSAIARAETIVASGTRTLRWQRSLLEEFRTRLQLLLGRRLQQSHVPERVQQLEARLRTFEQQLQALGLMPEHLQARRARHEGWRLAGRAVALLLLFPLAWLGLMLHAPAYLICEVLAYFFRTHGPDEGRATVKVLAAIVLMPLTWLLIALVVLFWFGWPLALLSLPVVALCGYAGLRWVEEAYELRGWMRALFILSQRRKQFLQLRREGRALEKELTSLR